MKVKVISRNDATVVMTDTYEIPDEYMPEGLEQFEDGQEQQKEAWLEAVCTDSDTETHVEEIHVTHSIE